MAQIRTESGVILRYETNEDGSITVTGAERVGSSLMLLDDIDGIRITAIGKKAFLGERALAEVYVPDTVCEIGDYAFAHCPSLRKAVLLNPDAELSRTAFAGCQCMEYICTGKEEETSRAALTAALVTSLSADYLLADTMSDDREWFSRWDNELMLYLAADDGDGYTDLVLCGEEDISLDMDAYKSHKRMDKCALCLVRLMNDDMLSDVFRDSYREYLLKHIKGCEDDAAWRAMLAYFSDSVEYFSLFRDIGGVTPDNLNAMLADMGHEASETKAFLLECGQSAGGNAFDMFSL